MNPNAIKSINDITPLTWDEQSRRFNLEQSIKEYESLVEDIPDFGQEHLTSLRERLAELPEITQPEPGIYDVGTFEFGSKVHLTDPCYDLDTWCMIEDHEVLAGTWQAYVWFHEDWGVRPFRLLAHHVDAGKQAFDYLSNSLSARTPSAVRLWQPIDGEVGVDSGQAGIFDTNKYRNDTLHPVPTRDRWSHVPDPERRTQLESAFPRPEREGENFYDAVSNLTLNLRRCGVLDGGVVASSGYGDGGYGAYEVRGEDGAVALAIDFYGDFLMEFE